LLVAMAGLSAAIVGVASFFPATRLWGVNHLAFVPPAVRAAALGLLLLTFVPAVARPLYRGSLRSFERLASVRASTAWILAASVAIASVGGFWALRSSTLLLGDGQLLVRSFEAAEEGHEGVIMRSPKAIVTEERIAPGTTLLYYAATKVSTDKFKKTPLPGMKMLNCILGGLFMLMLVRIAAGRFAGAEARLWLVVLTLFACSIELFFGYIENYTTPLLLLSIYVVLAFRALHNRGATWLPVVPLLLAVYAHVQCVLFVPSFVYLVLWKRARARRAQTLRYWMPCFSAACVLGVVLAGGHPGIRKFYVPLGWSNKSYALLSPNHLIDIANELLMLLPILPVVAALAWTGRRAVRAAERTRSRDPRALKDPAAWFTHPCEWQLATTILLPCALYVLAFHPEIGMARDWDLFTMATTAIVPMVLLVLSRYGRATAVTVEAAARFAVPSLAIVAVTGVAWVSINHSVERTIDRFERILTYDRTHASYAWENLAMLRHDQGQLEEAIATMRTAVDHSKNPRQSVRLAVYLEEAGRDEEAKQVLVQVLERHPDFTKARFRLIMFLENEQRWDLILDVAREGVKHNPEENMYHFFYGEALMHAGRVEEGIAVFRACSQKKLPDNIQKYVAESLRKHDAGAPTPR
jgi:hypothetical protein